MRSHIWTFGSIVLWLGGVGLCPGKALAQKADKKPAVSFAKEVVPTLTPLLLERYLDAADKIVEQAFKDQKFRQRYVVMPKDKKKRPMEEIVRGWIESFARRAYRRPVTGEEVGRLNRFVELAMQNKQ